MKLTWVNHASYILEYQDVKLICDPWIEGRVFNQSWSLLSKSVFTHEDYRSITHIWFSHEHPDHFFPPNIKQIPEEYRKNITVIFQKTIDRRVIEYCAKMNFKALVELKNYKPYYLGNDFKITIGKVKNDTDSWIALEVGNTKILNLNDCVLETKEMNQLQQYLDKVDVLLTQFSFASWVGNENDEKSILQHAQDKLSEVKTYVQTFKPTFTIPFASYVWFCAEDNFYFNKYANRIDDIDLYLSSLNTQSVVLYPGDEWSVNTSNNNTLSIKRYLEDMDNISIENCTVFNSESISSLTQITEKYRLRALSINNKRKLLTYKPFTAYLKDLQVGCKISYKHGFQFDSSITELNADILFHSQNLKFCLENEYGFDTILIAGTFQKPVGGTFQNFMEYEWVSALNNQGKRMSGLFFRLFNRLLR